MIRKLLTLGVVLALFAACQRMLRPQEVEQPAPGETMTFREKVRQGFPVRWGKLQIHTPWGAKYKVKGPTEMTAEFDLAAYRTPLETKIVSRRWEGNPGMYLANEEFLSGFCFFIDLVKGGFPVADFPALQWVTIREGYWYSRYALSYVQAQAHMGIHMVHGPYWTLKAVQIHRRNRLIRDRGERVPSNKDVMLGVYVPIYTARVGWPRAYEDANPTMLDYKSGDPHFLGRLPTSDTFDDPQSDKAFGWGVPAYQLDWRNTRWNHDRMDTTINLGAVAQTMKKKLVWTRCFFKSNHEGASPGDPSRTVELLGSSGDEGFRGLSLTMGALNGLLEIKASLIADERGRLGGINPLRYDPSRGLRYIPHEVEPQLIMVGDMPERPNGYHISDASSQLWDQASLLWTTTDYFDQCFKLQAEPGKEVAVFSPDPPADGGLIEQRSYRVALGLSNLIVQNLLAMHRSPSGVLASSWTPRGRTGSEVSVADLALAIVALGDYTQRMVQGKFDPQPELREKARKLAQAQAEFLVRVQGADGSFHERYACASGQGQGSATMRAQFFGIRGLVAAWHLTGNEIYLQRAKRSWNLLNREYWHEKSGLYRSERGQDVVTYTPMDLAAAYGAIRELVLAAPAHRTRPILERYVRFWTQSLNNSGMQMSEDHNTGEISFGIKSGDDDNDGIPFLTHSHGRHGIAPVAAGKIAINLGAAGNPAFGAISGELRVHPPAVRATYQPGTIPTTDFLLPEVEPSGEEYAQRQPVQRWMGWRALLAPSKKIAIGSERTGREIFRRNCMVCHGQRGEGVFGFDLKDDMFKFPHEEVANTITKGRFEKGMPTWGEGHDDLNVRETKDDLVLGNVLSEKEIARVARYIKTELAELYRRTETLEAYRQHNGRSKADGVGKK